MKNTNDFQISNAEMVTISRAEYEKLQAQSQRISELEQQVAVLMEAIRLARHKQFGASSEKISEDAMEQLSFLFNEAEVYAEKKAEDEPVTAVAAQKRHKKHQYTLENIPEGTPTEVVEHRLEGENLVCPECGSTMTEIGKKVVRTLEIIPARTVVKEHHYYTYACQRCSKEGVETPVVKAPREKNIIPGSFATPEAYRKRGTGCLYQINDHLWEGKYSPRDAHGKRISRNVYAHTREECEAKLAVVIEEMKSEIAAEKERLAFQESQESRSEIALL